VLEFTRLLRSRADSPTNSLPMHRLQISLDGNKRTSTISIGRGIRREVGNAIRESSFSKPRRVLVISNKRVFHLYGKDVISSLKRRGLQIFEWLMPEGERFKSFRVLEQAVMFLGNNGFERNDLVVALGGGVVGDLAGFTAAIYLRGIPFIQVPTTLLAQIDSSVGGKTGINLPVGKNMVGAFHQPSSVLIDTETLLSLPKRELVAGFCEMVKQSLIASQKLFDSTTKILLEKKSGDHVLQSTAFEELIAAQCGFKASIVANDEREAANRSDATSRRILNFGHTTAHALEAVTKYRVFRHGEAVGYGMLVAGEISKNLGLLREEKLELLREAVQLCGPLPKAADLNLNEIIRSLQHDKKSVRGEINWVLLEDIGLPKIVPGSRISAKLLRLSLKSGLTLSTRRQKGD
jgi:3-dehydroquinate synthase